MIKRLTVSQRRAPRKRRSGRDARGAYLVEILVAMACGTIVTLALVDMITQNMRQSSMEQNDLYAQTIIQELQGFSKTVKFSFLEQNIGQHNLLVSRSSPGSPTIRTQALQVDSVAKQWQEMSKNVAFAGTVLYDITPIDSSTLKITITLNWLDQGGFQRHRDSVVIVSKRGSNAWST